MDKINIFTATTIKGPAKQEAVGHYIIELIHEGKPLTYPPEGKDTFLYRESITAVSLTTELLANALHILPHIIRRYTDGNIESISCWIEPPAAGPFCNRWYEKWQQDGWINSKGEPVKDSDKWQVLCEEMEKTAKSFIFAADYNSYRGIMQHQAEKELKRHKTLEIIKDQRQKAGI